MGGRRAKKKEGERVRETERWGELEEGTGRGEGV